MQAYVLSHRVCARQTQVLGADFLGHVSEVCLGTLAVSDKKHVATLLVLHKEVVRVVTNGSLDIRACTWLSVHRQPRLCETCQHRITSGYRHCNNR